MSSVTSLKDFWELPSEGDNPPLDNKSLHGLPYPVTWTSRNCLCCGRPTTGKPSTCSSSRSSRKDPRLPLLQSPLGVPSLRFPTAGGPRHPGAHSQGPPQRFPAVEARVARCPTPHSGAAFFASSGRRGVLGLRRGPRLASPGLRGQEPESPRCTPSPPGSHSAATLLLAASGCADSPLVSCAPPLPGPGLRAPALGQLLRASPVGPSNGEARTPSAPGRLPREGARPPPRLHPLGGAAAIWGPCQSRPLRGPRRASAGGGSLTGRPPASAGALRCPEGAVAARRDWVEARCSGHGAPCHLRDPSGPGTRAPEAPAGTHEGGEVRAPNVRGGRRLLSLDRARRLPPLPPSPPRAGRRK